MSATVYLLSDFGCADTYVAQMKSVLISGSPPGTLLVDLLHSVPRGSVSEGAFHLWAAARVLKPGAVVLAVVDPGVGTSRRGVMIRSGGVSYIGPDNGLFGLLAAEDARELPKPPSTASSTFHGRDLFAPCAARAASDPGWSSFLAPVDPETLVSCSIAPPEITAEGAEVSVAHVDSFGNVLLWMDPGLYRTFVPASVRIAGGESTRLRPSDTYGDDCGHLSSDGCGHLSSDGCGLLYIEGSQGCMELAERGGSAARTLGLAAGDRILLEREKA